jgi:hypothetical protein
MLGSLKRGLLRPAAGAAASRAAAAGNPPTTLKLPLLLLAGGRRSHPYHRSSFAAAAAVGTEQGKQVHKKTRPFDKVSGSELEGGGAAASVGSGWASSSVHAH